MKIVRIVLWSILGIVLLAVIFFCGVTMYLTPERLSDLISKQISEYLNADIRIQNPRFTLWSTFPRFYLETDSVTIISHSLDSVAEKELAELPGNPKLLASASSVRGGIDILKLLDREYVMHDLAINSLHLNIVAINDSINNYDIIPAGNKDLEKLPYFTTNVLTLENPEVIDVFFADSRTKGRVELDSVVMRRLEKDTDYDLCMKGSVSATIENLKLFNNFPFSLEGDLDLGFHPFKIKFENFDINLESIVSHLDMTVDLQGDMKISTLSYKVSMVNLMKLLQAFPWLPLGNLSSINTDFNLQLSANLDRPYTFSSGELPWVTITARVEGNTIDYKASDGEVIPVRYSDIVGGLEFNGSHPEESIAFLHPTTFESENSSLTLAAKVNDLMEAPRITINFNGQSDLDFLSRRFPELGGWGLDGCLDFSGDAYGQLESISPEGLQHGLQKVEFNAKVNADSLKCKVGSYDFKTSKLSLSARSIGYSPDASDPLDVPISLDASGSDAVLVSPEGNIAYTSHNIQASTIVHGGNKAERLNVSDINVRARDFSIIAGKARVLTLSNVSALYGDAEPRPFLPDLPPALATHFIKVKAPEGTLRIPERPSEIHLDDIDISYNPDSLEVRKLGISNMSTHATLNGNAINIGNFINSGLSAPLRVNLDLDCDTVDINQLARNYYRNPGDKGSKPGQMDQRDTASVLIPRNITATLGLSIKESLYTDLNFHGISGSVKVDNGTASLDNLKINTDFGCARLDALYDTGDAQHLSVNFSGGLENIEITELIRNFHSLLTLMPEIINLSGTLSLDFDGGFLLFPDMDIMMPSIHANIDLDSRNLTIRQNDFIRRLAHRLLIKGNSDIHISDTDIHLKVRDNLLELYPFVFQLENYRLKAEGTNNFDGNLYYHIAVMKSPVPFPFGVNIEGKFPKPKIRLGRAGYNARKGEEITLANDEGNEINIVTELKYYLNTLLRKAAENNDKQSK